MWSTGDDNNMEDGSMHMTPEQEDSNSSSDHNMPVEEMDSTDQQSYSNFGIYSANNLSSPLAHKLDLTASPSRSEESINPRVEHLIQLYKGLPPDEQCEFLGRMLDETSTKNLRYLRKILEPRFQKDFLSDLPVEIGLKIINSLDYTDLHKLSAVSKNWRILSEDTRIWRGLSGNVVFDYPVPSNRVDGAWAATALGQGVQIPDHITKYHLVNHRHFKQLNKMGPVCDRAPEKARCMRMQKICQNWREKTIRGSCVLKGHEDHVITCMHIHGDLLVTGSDDNTLKVWSVDRGEVLFNLLGHTGGVWTSQISSCGRFIVSGSTDRTVKVWCAKEGTLIHTLQGHTSTVRCMAMWNSILVTGSRDTTLRIWNVETGACYHILSGHQAAVRCVQFDGILVVSGGYDFTVKVWAAQNGQCLKTLCGHQNRVYSLLFDSERGIVASGSLDTTIRVWDLNRADGEECVSLLQGHTSLTSGMQLKGNLLVSCNADSMVRVWDISDGSCLFYLQGHRSAITCLVFFGDDIIATSSDDGSVKLWDVRRGVFLRDLVTLDSGGNGGCIWRLCATPTLLACAVGSRNNTEETKVILLDFDSVYP